MTWRVFASPGSSAPNEVPMAEKAPCNSTSGTANRVITCYKLASTDPLASTNPSLTTVQWRQAPVNQPGHALLGAVYASRSGVQRRAALLTLMIAALFDLLFFVVSELPATVPVALALVVIEVWNRFGS